MTIIWDAESLQHYGDNTNLFLTLRRYNNQTKNETVNLQNQAVRVCNRDDKSDFVRVEYSVVLYQMVNHSKTERNRSAVLITEIQEMKPTMGKQALIYYVELNIVILRFPGIAIASQPKNCKFDPRSPPNH